MKAILDDLLFPYVSDAFPNKYVGKETQFKQVKFKQVKITHKLYRTLYYICK